MKKTWAVIGVVCVAALSVCGCYRENPYEKYMRAKMRGDRQAMKEAYVEILRDELDRRWWQENGADWYPDPGR
jgi:hypothetical protein